MKRLTSFLSTTFVTTLIFIFSTSMAQAIDVEHDFGGYFRTRFYTQSNFSGNDDQSQDLSQVDTRARLSYTATFDEDFEVLMLFEMNGIWGENNEDGGSYASMGAKGDNDLQVKYLYTDFNEMDVNFKLGTQPMTLNRGFLVDDAITGIKVTYASGDESFSVPVFWGKVYEGGMGYDEDADLANNEADIDYLAVYPTFALTDSIKLTPTLLYATTGNGGPYHEGEDAAFNYIEDYTVTYTGLDFDMELDFLDMNIWATLISMSGTITRNYYPNATYNGSLAAVGVDMDLGFLKVRGEFFTATGDDDAFDDTLAAFQVPAGQSYYWAEIMGAGIFDNQVSSGSGGSAISNITAMNVGVDYQFSDAIKISADIWTASSNEANDNADEGAALGTELDIKVSYQLQEYATVDLVYATLQAGEATTADAENAADPSEFGLQFVASF